LVSESVPSIEEKYNLDEDEVKLNTLRDSDMTSEEFINSLVDYRMQAVSAQRELSTTDYEAVSDDGIFVKSLRDFTLKLLMRRLQTNYLKQRSIELRYYNRSDETAVHNKRKTTTSKKKTIKYSASSWKHKGMRLLRL
jgi:hypothetical protein